MDRREKIRRIRANRALLVLLRLDVDDVACRCGELWETGRDAVEDLSGSDLLAFESSGREGWNGPYPVWFSACPDCNPVRDEEADRLAEMLRLAKKLPAHDDPDPLLEELAGL